MCQTKDVPPGPSVPCTLTALSPSINLLHSMNLPLHGTSPQHLPQAVETARSRLCHPLHGCPVHHTVFLSIHHRSHTGAAVLSCHGTAHHAGGRDETGASGAIAGCAFPGTGLALSQPVPLPATLLLLRTRLCSRTRPSPGAATRSRQLSRQPKCGGPSDILHPHIREPWLAAATRLQRRGCPVPPLPALGTLCT